MTVKSRNNASISITGVGIVCPAGTGIGDLAKALLRGQSLVREITHFETQDLPCSAAAWIDRFDATTYMEKRLANRLDRAGQLFVASSVLGVQDANISICDADPDRVGIYEGTSLGGIPRAMAESDKLSSEGYRAVNPMCVNAAMTGAGAGVASMILGVTGPVSTFSNGSTSSHTAISAAVSALHRGEIDLAIAGGSDAPVCRQIVAAFSRARMLSTLPGPPEHACRPFDLNRNGTILGEAGAVLILERTNDAKSAGRRIHANIVATAQTNDAYSLSAPRPDAFQQSRAIELALTRGKIEPAEIDYVSAHGTGTRHNDFVESIALKNSLGPHAYRVAVSSSKALLGHPLGACTAIETVKVIAAMENGFIPSTANLTDADPKCDLDYVPLASRHATVQTALVNNSSFGGKNGTLILKSAGSS